MTRRRLIALGLRCFWRSHLGTMLGAAVGAAVLVGALAVGDSVNHTLARQAHQRIGRVSLALNAGDRFFVADLAERLAARVPGAEVAPILQLQAIASTFDQSHRALGVPVLGIDERFFDLALRPSEIRPPDQGEVILNEQLARQLDVGVGDGIVFRIRKPTALPAESALSNANDLTTALRVTVAAIASDDAFGRFSLHANQIPPFNAFFAMDWLQTVLNRPGRANLLLVGGSEQPFPLDVAAADAALVREWTIADAEVMIHDLPQSQQFELRSDRIFIEDSIATAAARSDGPLTGVLTYFVTELRVGTNTTPYSMVAAMGALGPNRADAPPPAHLADDEIIINQWLADDLSARIGDDLTLRYFVLDDDQKLVEESASFRIAAITPLAGWADDPSLMPEFPGIAEAERSRDWRAGIPIDTGRIRDKDEVYWKKHRGTPKAFVSLKAGQRMWANRFGSLTAIRGPLQHKESLSEILASALEPRSFAMYFNDVREHARRSGTATTDFGGLFLGLSFFLIVAAVLLTALLFVFGIEQRANEIGTLLAIGFRPGTVRRLLFGEGAVIAVVGGAVGILLGLVYTRLVLIGLTTVWRDAVASAQIEYHASLTSVGIGAGLAILAAMGAMWFTLRAQVRRPVTELLRSGAGVLSGRPSRSRRLPVSLIVAVAGVLVTGGILATAGGKSGQSAAGAFFGAGAALLVAAIACSRLALARLDRGSTRAPGSIGLLGVRNAARRIGRSLATVSILACGVFLVVAVGANRLGVESPRQKDSGTGGFALFATATVGVTRDLNTAEGRSAFGLLADQLAGVRIVSGRLRDGDDASCLNLNLPQHPHLLGINPDALAADRRFSFAKKIDGASDNPWLLLRSTSEPGVIPAIGDDASVTWTLHKKLGDTIDYVDERGEPFRVRIVATLSNSILQGMLVIGEDHFRRLFPSESGARLFLIDVQERDRAESVAAVLSRQLADVGLEVTPTTQRLTAFNAVQNTYLAIFQALGALGLLLGSVGLGLVVLRNVLERRGELAILSAIGFTRRSVRWMVFSEHGALLLLGVMSGTVSAGVAIVPAISGRAVQPPLVPLAVVVLAVAASGILWVWLATLIAVRGPLVTALRSE